MNDSNSVTKSKWRHWLCKLSLFFNFLFIFFLIYAYIKNGCEDIGIAWAESPDDCPGAGPFIGDNISCQAVSCLNYYFHEGSECILSWPIRKVKPENMMFSEIGKADLQTIVDNCGANNIYMFNIAYNQTAATEYAERYGLPSHESAKNMSTVAFAYVDLEGNTRFANVNKVCPPPGLCETVGLAIKRDPYTDQIICP
jgi:hypothetical protein